MRPVNIFKRQRLRCRKRLASKFARASAMILGHVGILLGLQVRAESSPKGAGQRLCQSLRVRMTMQELTQGSPSRYLSSGPSVTQSLPRPNYG